MACHALISAAILGFVQLHVRADSLPQVNWNPPENFDAGEDSSNDSYDWSTLPDHLLTTIDLPTHVLRGVPEDVREFWADTHISISVVTVLANDIAGQLNITIEKTIHWINVTTKFIEDHLHIIINSDWPTRSESSAEHQLLCAEKIADFWKQIIANFKEEIKDVHPLALKSVDELNEMWIRLDEAEREVARRIYDLKKVIKKRK